MKIDKDKENWPFFHIQYLNMTLMSNSNKSNYFLPGYTNLKSSNNISMETQTGKKEDIWVFQNQELIYSLMSLQ